MNILRPELNEKEVEFLTGEIRQHRLVRYALTAIPANPRQSIIDPQSGRHHEPFDHPELAMRKFGIDLLALGIKVFMPRRLPTLLGGERGRFIDEGRTGHVGVYSPPLSE